MYKCNNDFVRHLVSMFSVVIIFLVLSVFLFSVAVCIYFCLFCVLLCLSVILVGLCVFVFIFYGPCCLIQMNICLSISLHTYLVSVYENKQN